MSDWDKILDFLEYDNTQKKRKNQKFNKLEGNWKNSGKNNFLKFSTY